MHKKNKWSLLLLLILLCTTCTLEGNIGGDTSYTINYDKNGGSGEPPRSQVVKSGNSTRLLSGDTLSKNGFTFGGWNTEPSGSGRDYSAGSFYTPTSNVTLYAKWIPVTVPTFTVTFNANGASGAPPANISVKSGSSLTLPNGNGLSKSGFTFGGWDNNSSGTGTQYGAGSSYTVIADVTLYAIWVSTDIIYTVSFNPNGGSGSVPSSLTVQAGSTITLPNGNGLSKSGFTFGGWNTNASGSGMLYGAGSIYTPNSSITLYANWNAIVTTPTSFTVSFNANGGDGTVPVSQIVQSGSSITLPNGSGLSKSGYTFGGWNTNTTGTGTNYSSGDTYTVTANITLYAKWNTNVASYTVSFNANGGSGTAPTSQTTQSGSSITLPNGSGLSKSGYTFGGWNTNSTGTGTSYSAGDSYTVTANITLYAKWNTSVASYTVTFNANGGSGTVPTAQTAQSGSAITLPNGSGLSKSGYTFGGWNTNSTGTGTNYNAGESYTVTANITLYAKWDNTLDTISGLAAKLTWLQSNAVSGGDYTIEVNANENISPQTLSYSGKNNITIRLKGGGSIRTISLSGNGAMFTVSSGVTLALGENIKLVGRSSNDTALISVSGGNLILNEGAIITGNNNSFGTGGGVFMNSGTFTMNGGEISGNTSNVNGGGVYVLGGSFTMHNGDITGNSTYNGGGGVYVFSNSTFSMSGGKISGNTNTGFWGGGVCVDIVGTFTMSGGTISGNTVNHEYYSQAESGGGGVFVAGTFTKSGGTITSYASDKVNGNVVKNSSGVVQNNRGHAVCVFPDYSTQAKRRETTAGPMVNLDSTKSGVAGGWEN